MGRDAVREGGAREWFRMAGAGTQGCGSSKEFRLYPVIKERGDGKGLVTRDTWVGVVFPSAACAASRPQRCHGVGVAICILPFILEETPHHALNTVA